MGGTMTKRIIALYGRLLLQRYYIKQRRTITVKGGCCCGGGDIKIGVNYYFRRGTVTIGIAPDKVCKHLDSWGEGGFSMEKSKHTYKGQSVGLAGNVASWHMDYRP